MVTFNDKCPSCDGPVNITIFTVRCEAPIRETGWAVMATHRNTNGSEYFSCPKCEVTVPAMWVYKEMSQKEAQGLMKGWGANVYSIHNRKPLPKDEGRPKKDDREVVDSDDEGRSDQGVQLGGEVPDQARTESAKAG